MTKTGTKKAKKMTTVELHALGAAGGQSRPATGEEEPERYVAVTKNAGPIPERLFVQSNFWGRASDPKQLIKVGGYEIPAGFFDDHRDALTKPPR